MDDFNGSFPNKPLDPEENTATGTKNDPPVTSEPEIAPTDPQMTEDPASESDEPQTQAQGQFDPANRQQSFYSNFGHEYDHYQQQNTNIHPPYSPYPPYPPYPPYQQYGAYPPPEPPRPDIMQEVSYTPPLSENAFREDLSVVSVVQKKHPFAFKGETPLIGESPLEYNSRMAFEREKMHEEAGDELQRAATRSSLVMLLYTLLSLVLPVAATLIVHGLMGYPDENSTLFNTVSTLAVYIAIYPATFPLLILLGNLGTSHRTKGFFKKPECSPLYVAKITVIACGISYVIGFLYDLFISIFPIQSVSVAEPFTSVWEGILYFVAFCIFAPVFEELLFRGVFLSDNLKFGGWYACIASSVFFALFHLNHDQLLYTFFAGLMFSLVTLKSGSLIPSMIMHSLMNLISVLQMLSITLIDNYHEIYTVENWRPQGELYAIVFYLFTLFLPYILMLIGVLMLILELCLNRRSFSLPKGDSPLSRGDKASLFISTPAFLSVSAIMLILIIITAIFSGLPI